MIGLAFFTTIGSWGPPPPTLDRSDSDGLADGKAGLTDPYRSTDNLPPDGIVTGGKEVEPEDGWVIIVPVTTVLLVTFLDLDFFDSAP